MQTLFLPRHVIDGSLFLPSDTYLASSKAGSLPFLVLSLFTSVSKKNNTSLLLAFLTKEKCLQSISSLALSLIILSFIYENCFSSILSMHWNSKKAQKPSDGLWPTLLTTSSFSQSL